MKNLEHRSFNFEVRAREDETNQIIEGMPIVYDSKTDIGFFDEIILKGALNDADLTDVRFLVNHDEKRIPLARSRRNNGNSTMKLDVTDEGLFVTVKLDTENNSEARSLYSAVKRGDISGMSFMFSIDEEEWEDLESEHPTRMIKKIGSLVEVSACTFPAYADTTINTRAKLDSSAQALENALKKFETENRNKKQIELEKLRFDFFVATEED